MNVVHRDSDLERLEFDPDHNAGFSRPIVRAYRKVMQQIRAAVDERPFRNLKSLHFEKLRGDRSGQHSLRLNDQWRLIIEIEPGRPPKVVHVIEICDYH
jgi:toxin HigB-1